MSQHTPQTLENGLPSLTSPLVRLAKALRIKQGIEFSQSVTMWAATVE
ncbi:MAG: hypothetical protein KME40_07745 [Komarekiella atlantica HA4396-MV6]|nr:hypothetical protein [Komarekiella atlantica HA4396-MV6]